MKNHVLYCILMLVLGLNEFFSFHARWALICLVQSTISYHNNDEILENVPLIVETMSFYPSKPTNWEIQKMAKDWEKTFKNFKATLYNCVIYQNKSNIFVSIWSKQTNKYTEKKWKHEIFSFCQNHKFCMFLTWTCS